MSEGDRNRLVACRACGNRVPRDARRCPACGTREPTAAATESTPSRPTATESAAPAPTITDTAAEHPQSPLPRAPRAAAGRTEQQRQSAPRLRRSVVMMLGGLFALAAAGVTAVYLTSPPLPPPAVREPEPAPAPSVGPAAPPTAAPPTTAPGPVVRSRSRGRTDWVFFFKPGDWLTRMADDGLLGVVVRVEKTHAFGDGSSGPAYVVQSMEGEERVVDADELERTARLR